MIVIAGDAVIDLFALPVGTDVGSAESFAPRTGGAPCNVAMVLGRLGRACRFVGAVGMDAHGDRLVAEMARAGVDVDSVLRLPARTGVTFVRVGLDGTRTFLSYRAGGADLALSPAELARLPGDPLAGATWLHLTSSSRLVEPFASTTEVLLAAARVHGVALSLDLNVRRHLWTDTERMNREVRMLAGAASIVKASEEDLHALDLPATVEALCHLAPQACVILTLAERGARAMVGGESIVVPAERVDVVDATGAGDVFMAALLASLSARNIGPDEARFRDPGVWREALALACRLGSRAVTALGATEAVRDLAAERTELAGNAPAG